MWSVQYANSSRKKDLRRVFIISSTDIDHQHNICEDLDINGASLQYYCMESKFMVMLGAFVEIIYLFDRWERHFQSQIWSHMKQVWRNECNPTLPSNLLMCHFKPNLWKINGHHMEIVQFYYFWPFTASTSAIVLLLLHWPHPASAHLLQQGDVYLQWEEIKALLHELQICKSFTVQIDCAARTADDVHWTHWGPSIWNPNQDTHVASLKKNLDFEILRKINKKEWMKN